MIFTQLLNAITQLLKLINTKLTSAEQWHYCFVELLDSRIDLWTIKINISVYYGVREVQNKSRCWKQNKLQTQMKI